MVVDVAAVRQGVVFDQEDLFPFSFQLINGRQWKWQMLSVPMAIDTSSITGIALVENGLLWLLSLFQQLLRSRTIAALTSFSSPSANYAASFSSSSSGQ
jgi:hypothetical protein